MPFPPIRLLQAAHAPAIREAIGQRLRRLREDSGMTVEEAAGSMEAGEVSISPGRLQAIEAGEVDADYIEILELLRLYDADEEAFGRELLAAFPELQASDESSATL